MVNIFAQRYTTSNYTGGIRIAVEQDNPVASMGTVPTKLKVQLFKWVTNYAMTILTTPLVVDYVIVPSEEVENDYMWIFLFHDTLAPSTYLWRLTVIEGDITGVFHVRNDTTSTYNHAFADDWSTTYDFQSEILGLDAETYEKVITPGDTFTGGYQIADVSDNIKINRGSTASPNYVNKVEPQQLVTDGTKKIGRIASGSTVKLS